MTIMQTISRGLSVFILELVHWQTIKKCSCITNRNSRFIMMLMTAYPGSTIGTRRSWSYRPYKDPLKLQNGRKDGLRLHGKGLFRKIWEHAKCKLKLSSNKMFKSAIFYSLDFTIVHFKHDFKTSFISFLLPPKKPFWYFETFIKNRKIRFFR